VGEKGRVFSIKDGKKMGHRDSDIILAEENCF
jgi:hypothetical protein